MGKFWDAIKLILALVVILFLFRLVFSTALGPMDLSFIVVSAIVVVGIVGIYFYKYGPLRKIAPPLDNLAYYRKAVVKCMEAGIAVPTMISDNGHIDFPPGFDDMILGNHTYWFRFKENHPRKGNITRNIYYDVINDRLLGRVSGDDLHDRPSKRVEGASRIAEISNTGRVPIRAATPQMVITQIEKEKESNNQAAKDESSNREDEERN